MTQNECSQSYAPTSLRGRGLPRMARRLLGLAVTATLSVACAGNRLQTIQAVQANDPSLSCPELLAELARMDEAIGKLRKEIDGKKSSAKAADLMGVLSPSGGIPGLNSLMASFSRDDAQERAEVLSSYQRRRDILMQQYHSKACQDGERSARAPVRGR